MIGGAGRSRTSALSHRNPQVAPAGTKGSVVPTTQSSHGSAATNWELTGGQTHLLTKNVELIRRKALTRNLRIGVVMGTEPDQRGGLELLSMFLKGGSRLKLSSSPLNVFSSF